MALLFFLIAELQFLLLSVILHRANGAARDCIVVRGVSIIVLETMKYIVCSKLMFGLIIATDISVEIRCRSHL